MALIDTLVSYFKMDESAGSNFTDAHGSNTATLTGTVGTTTGIINGGRSVGGVSGYGSVTPTGLNNASVSWSGWINFTSISAYMTPGMLTNGGAWTQGYGFYVEGGVLKWFVNTYSTSPAVSAALSTGVTYHFVGTFDDTSKDLKLYMNGSLVSTQTRSITLSYTSTDLKLLFGATGTNLNGWCDEFAIFSSAISAADVTALYNGGAGLAYPFSGGAAFIAAQNRHPRQAVNRASRW